VKHPILHMATQPSKVNKKGMVTIPSRLREKYNLHEGTEVVFVEELGSIVLVPIMDIEDLRPYLPTHEEMLKTIEENRELELKLENDE
jgi:AbrB family looped-hinge helix DNA binding protein